MMSSHKCSHITLWWNALLNILLTSVMQTSFQLYGKNSIAHRGSVLWNILISNDKNFSSTSNKINSLLHPRKRLAGLKPISRNSELIFRKRNPLAVFLDRAGEFNIRIINSLSSLHRQSAVCETDLAALKLKQKTCQFGQFLQANPVEEWTVCSLPNLYFRDLWTVVWWTCV